MYPKKILIVKTSRNVTAISYTPDSKQVYHYKIKYEIVHERLFRYWQGKIFWNYEKGQKSLKYKLQMFEISVILTSDWTMWYKHIPFLILKWYLS